MAQAVGAPPTPDELTQVAQEIQGDIVLCFDDPPGEVIVQTTIRGDTGAFFGLQLAGPDAERADIECIYEVLHEAPRFRRFEGELEVQWRVGDVASEP
ncbi:MAG: hypothetical protein H6726_17480 [Sandaracinaceae bacterium]|nr:hypothetical protein [Sandaracinaceae bacterium]